MGSVVTGVIVAAVVGLAIRSIILKKKKGGGCGCGCSGCSMAESCHSKK